MSICLTHRVIWLLLKSILLYIILEYRILASYTEDVVLALFLFISPLPCFTLPKTDTLKCLVKSLFSFHLTMKCNMITFLSFAICFFYSNNFPPFILFFSFHCYNFFLHSQKLCKTFWIQLSFSVTHLLFLRLHLFPGYIPSCCLPIACFNLDLSASRPDVRIPWLYVPALLKQTLPLPEYKARLCSFQLVEYEQKWCSPLLDLSHQILQRPSSLPRGYIGSQVLKTAESWSAQPWITLWGSPTPFCCLFH